MLAGGVADGNLVATRDGVLLRVGMADHHPGRALVREPSAPVVRAAIPYTALRALAARAAAFEAGTLPWQTLFATGSAASALDAAALERHLSKADFARVFELDPATFLQLPRWKQLALRRKVRLHVEQPLPSRPHAADA